MILAYSMLFCDYYHPEFGVGGTHPSNTPFRGTVKSPRVVLVKRSVEAKRDPSPRKSKTEHKYPEGRVPLSALSFYGLRGARAAVSPRAQRREPERAPALCFRRRSSPCPSGA